jgi:hypothetical protein
MLNLEATSQKTMQIISSLFENCGASVPNIPIISKSYDDEMLRPANKQIGERDCACGDRCMAMFLGKFRHGPDTNLAFVCTEFLLPIEREEFAAGKGLPARRKKCLVCTRYLTSFLYYKARVDPSFSLSHAAVDAQSFANSSASPVPDTSCDLPDLTELSNAQRELPESASAVLTDDSYKPEAMLFVDEEWINRQSAREGNMTAFQFVPIVKFCSHHYVYSMTDEGPRITQTGIGSNDPTGTGLLFREAPVANEAAPPEHSSI